MTPIIPCINCKNLILNKKRVCLAFRDGIPREMLIGENQHIKPFKGDRGIRYEPIKKKV